MLEISTIIALVSVAVGTLSLCFGIMKWLNAQTHGRIKQIKDDLKMEIVTLKNDTHKRIDDVEISWQRQFANSLDTIKDMMAEIKQDVRWLMQHSSDIDRTCDIAKKIKTPRKE